MRVGEREVGRDEEEREEGGRDEEEREEGDGRREGYNMNYICK